MKPDQAAPLWLWQLARWGFLASLLGVAALAFSLYLGLAAPPRAGPLRWQDDFKGDVTRWEFVTPSGGGLAPHAGALLAEFTAPGQAAFGLTPGPAGEFTLEIAGTQTEGESGAAYGLVFGWQDEAHYSAALVNGNGYAEAYRQDGAGQEQWFVWQQWPHILVPPESNRVRVDARGTRITVRVNDELLVEAELAAGAAPGRVGVIARSIGPAKVVFSWVRLWEASILEDLGAEEIVEPDADDAEERDKQDEHVAESELLERGAEADEDNQGGNCCPAHQRGDEHDQAFGLQRHNR